MTTEQTIIRRADVVAEILATRHEGHDQLPLAINRARNAVMDGLSAHAALERGEQWVREAERVQGKPRTTLAELLFAIPGTRAHDVRATPDGYRAYLTDYHTGRRVVIRVEDTQPELHGIDGGAA